MNRKLLSGLCRAMVGLTGLLVGAPTIAQVSTAPMGAMTYLHTDLTGNVVLATNTTGATVWDERYLPYGAKRLGSAGGVNGVDSSTQKYGYHDKALDPETGLQYFGARYYDPLSGRFSGIDPASPLGGNLYTFNRYAFANGNPYHNTDPDGGNVLSVYDWWSFGRDAGGLLVTEIVYTAAVISGNTAVANLASDRMVEQRFDAAASTFGVINVVPGSARLLKLVERGSEEAKTVGVVYKRVNKADKAAKPYIGRAKSEERYAARQKEHGRANPDADYEYTQIERAEEGQALREAEQRQITEHGGPTNKNNPDGGTENKRNEIAQ